MEKWWFSDTPRGYLAAGIVAVIFIVLGIAGGALDHPRAVSKVHAGSQQ